ncbi:E3 ubiquitin-protein ligase TRIM35-like [Latimeria chalumnae]|uniref:E3 ubiquitin-protein ligase TRIM35-like n=1 Tax=Latimeria chalumnae TaxID=7897 RepID=UPI00313ADEA4
MDAQAASGCVEESLSCSMCHEMFTDPVTLKCGHNFCRKCVCDFWKQKTSLSCPFCRASSSNTDLIRNHTLRDVVEAVKREEKKAVIQSKYLCSQHGEKRKLYCSEDQETICLVCQTSKKHKAHPCCPVEEAAMEFKGELKARLLPLQESQKKFIEVEEEYKKCLNHLQDQALTTEKEIKEDFVKLHKFLHKEEKNLLADLKNEKEEKEQKMREKIKNISEEMISLSSTIMDIEKKMDQDDHLFLMNLQDIRTRVARTYKEPEIPSGALIDVARYLGNLQHRVWNKMLSIIHPVTVTLDPNTAAPWLTLSEDLTAVTRGSTRREDLPDNPERFDQRPCVLGSKSFTSGRHSWVVDVEKQTEWILGVAAESASRKGNINLKPEGGYWTVQLFFGRYAAFIDEGLTRLKVLKTPKKVLVCVDYEAGKVSFSNADDRSHIYTFTHKFKHKIFPFFYLLTEEAPLRICNL